jgi:rhodanese-related sulfurtransferase
METIGRQELKAKLDANQDIKLVMTVGGWTFRARHIPGSLNFPSPGRALQMLRCDDEIILYSVSNGRQDTRAAFDALTAHGYGNVRCYVGGLADWEDAGYPVEGTSVGSTATNHRPHGHSPRGLELDGGCPHCDNGWSGHGWPPAEITGRDCLGNRAAMAAGQPERRVVQPYKTLAGSRPLHRR